MIRHILILNIIIVFIFSPTSAYAQEPTPLPGPVYIVQEGDTLWVIAARFNVSVNDLIAANGLTTNDIFVNDRLFIPGLQGLSGTLITKTIPYGETLRSILRQYRLDETLLRKLNHIISPTELYAGANLVLLQKEDKPAWTARSNLNAGETLLELAVRQGTDAWTITSLNNLSGTWAGFPNDVLYLPSGTSTAGPTGLPSSFISVDVYPLPIIQGTTAEVRIIPIPSVTLRGLLVDHPLNFSKPDDTTWVALQGVHAMTEPGLYPLRIEATLSDGSKQSFEQMVLITTGYYPKDPPLTVDPSTIDPAVTEPEDQWLLSVVSPITHERYWRGIFQLPVDNQYCIRSNYGNRRSYNGGDYLYFHTGIDFGVCSTMHPFDIYAPADGVVVFTGLKTVRGNVTIIDHGWGIYSGLYHQEEIYVGIGDHVVASQLIGKIGETGRVTGPHLHWDLWVNGVQVNPTQWLNKIFP